MAYYAEELYTTLDIDYVDESIGLTLTSNDLGYKVFARRSKNITSAIIPETYKGLPVTEIADNSFTNCAELESVYIPNSITRIGTNAFANCPKLTSLTIPASVTRIGNNALSYNKFETITVEDGNPVYHSAGNCLIETESKTLIAGCKNSVIPRDGSVERIESLAFFRCDITSIVIPESIIEIESSAFRECTSLKTVYNLSDLDIVAGSITHGNVAYFAEIVYTSLEEEDV